MFVRTLIQVLLIFPATNIAFSQTEGSAAFDINRRFSKKELIADLDMLKDSLEILHPALYRYLTEKELGDLFKTAAQNIRDQQTLSSFFSLLAPVVGRIGDLHTTMDLPDEYYQAIASSARIFPFDVRIIDGQVYVASNNSKDSGVVIGSRIISINNIPVGDLLKKMESCFSAEGNNRSFKIRRLNRGLRFCSGLFTVKWILSGFISKVLRTANDLQSILARKYFR